jgi:microcystin-dependent protein
MATALQLRGGTSAQHAAFTGALKEVTVDTTKKSLVVHDGVTPGGSPLPSVAEMNAAIAAAVATAVSLASAPVGSPVFVHGTVAEPGTLKANGAEVSRMAYAALFAKIGTLYGAGNGTTTFKLPDWRGKFIRGLDDGAGIDTGRVLGSPQGDAIRNITGNAGAYFRATNSGAAGALSASTYGSTPPRAGSVGTDAGDSATLFFNASLVVPTAAENRPINDALLACIKY